MPAPLPFGLKFRDRVDAGPSDLFTGELQLSTSASRTDWKEPVYVKFVDGSYGVDAHRLLAEHKGVDGLPHPLAPKLYGAGEIMPGRTMVVMESLPDDAHTLLWYQPRPEPDPEDPESCYLKRPPAPEPVSWDELADLRAAVELLHRHDFVHGDIRPDNVMLQRPASDASGGGNGGASRAYLIDFDGAGKEGTARYHANLNPAVRWPRPLSELNGQPITKLHDLFMLNVLSPKRTHERDGDDLDGHKRRREDNLRPEAFGVWVFWDQYTGQWVRCA